MLKRANIYIQLAALLILSISCNSKQEKKDKLQHMTQSITASQILGDSNYRAISYGGYRDSTRDVQPTISELKDDMRILSAMGIKVLRTYNTKLKKASNLLQAISELKKEDSGFEMYVMLGAWINCKDAWTDIPPNHEEEDEAGNKAEILRAVELARAYPDIVKIIAVGNEAMVKWAENYYVQPSVILKWVNYLQNLKSEGQLESNLWITSSDNFASWGGGDSLYHCSDLEKLIKAVDFVSLHTYPMHDTHYHPVFWGVLESELHIKKSKAIERAMKRAVLYAQKQYHTTKKYIHSIDSTKPIHIGETGWASESTGHYGAEGSKACDEYKEGLYYMMMRKWTDKERISCFYFEAFNEKWKDQTDPKGSENHFGLFKINGEAKYALWNEVDKGLFEGLSRNGNPIKKTYQGNFDKMLEDVELPPIKQLR
ncbi:glycosyl hydrolase family 17 [bacterium]|nr:glycosyl hydrolase family 17 [bacterium]